MTVLSKELLSILRCPESRTPLTLADESVVDALNQAIDDGRLQNRGGSKVERRLEAGLLREDGTIIYPVVDGIPIMLVDEGIPLDQLAARAAQAQT